MARLVDGPNRICPKTRLALVGPRVGVRLDRKEREWVTTSRVVLVALNRGVGEEAAPVDPEALSPAAAEAPPARPVSRKTPDRGIQTGIRAVSRMWLGAGMPPGRHTPRTQIHQQPWPTTGPLLPRYRTETGQVRAATGGDHQQRQPHPSRGLTLVDPLIIAV